MLSVKNLRSKSCKRTAIVAFLVCIGMALPLYMQVSAYTWAEPVDVPTLVTGESWKYWTVSHDTTTQTQSVPTIATINLYQNYMSDNTTYTVSGNIVKTNGIDTYKESVNGNAVFSGTYDYIDLTGIIGDESGCFAGTGTNTGNQYKRVSDLAFVKASLNVVESATFYVDCTNTVSSLLAPINNQAATSAVDVDVPLNDLQFPMKTGNNWHTSTTITTVSTPAGGGQATTTTATYDFDNTVNGTVTHAVTAGSFTAFEIYESGTVVTDTSSKNLEQSVYYAPDVKGTIDKTQDNEKLQQFTVHFYPDLSITTANITVDPASPVQDLLTKVNATIMNKGDEDASNFKAELWSGSTKIDTQDVTLVKSKKTANVSFDWTPSVVGSNELTVLVDAANVIQEYSETNNSAKITVTVLEPMADLAVATSDITAPSEVPIDTVQTIKAVVHNLGNLDASKVVVIFKDGSTQFGESTFDTLAQGATVEASASWKPATLGGHTITVKLDPDSNITEITKGNNQASKNVNVVQLNYSFSLTTTVVAKDIKPGETAQYTFSVKNTGKKQDTVGLIVTPPPETWTANTDKSSLSLASGSTQQVLLSVMAPAGTRAGTYGNVTVQATSQGDNTYKQFATYTTKVLQVAGVNLTLKTVTADMGGNPSASVPYEFIVENRGNAPDTFTLSVETQKQWTTTIVGSSTTGELQPGAKKTVSVQTTVPSTALANDKEAVTFKAKSAFDTNYERESTVLVTCLHVYDLSASASPITSEVAPGESATFTISVSNDGNGDETVNLTVKGSPEIPQDWTVTYDAKTTVKAGKQKDVLVTILAPKTALAQDYTLTFELVGGSGDKLDKPITLTVKQIYDFDITVVPTTAQIKAGNSFTATVTVKNNGNGDDTITLTTPTLDPKLTATFSETSVKLGAGQTKDITVTVTSKSSTSGTKTLEIKGASKDGKTTKSANVSLSVTALAQQSNMMLYVLLIVIIIGVVAVVAVVMFKRKK